MTKKSTMQNKTIIIISIIVLISIFFGIKYFYTQSQSEKAIALSKKQSLLFKRDSSFTIGPDTAKVQLVEYFDPACEGCAKFHPYVKEILKQYKDDIHLIITELDIPTLNGIEMIKKIKEIKDDIPIFIVSAQIDLIEETKKLGVKKFFKKPVLDIFEIKNTINKYL